MMRLRCLQLKTCQVVLVSSLRHWSLSGTCVHLLHIAHCHINQLHLIRTPLLDAQNPFLCTLQFCCFVFLGTRFMWVLKYLKFWKPRKVIILTLGSGSHNKLMFLKLNKDKYTFMSVAAIFFLKSVCVHLDVCVYLFT